MAEIVTDRGPSAGRYRRREKSHRLQRIMRNGDRRDLEPVDAHRRAHRQWRQRYIRERGRLRSAIAREDGPSPAAHAPRDAADMIAMIVREQTRIDRRGIDACRLEAIGECARAKSRVDEHTCSVALDEDCVSAAAGAEYPHLHSLSPTVQRARCAAANCSRPRSVSFTCRRAMTRSTTSI